LPKKCWVTAFVRSMTSIKSLSQFQAIANLTLSQHVLEKKKKRQNVFTLSNVTNVKMFISWEESPEKSRKPFYSRRNYDSYRRSYDTNTKASRWHPTHSRSHIQVDIFPKKLTRRSCDGYTVSNCEYDLCEPGREVERTQIKGICYFKEVLFKIVKYI